MRLLTLLTLACCLLIGCASGVTPMTDAPIKVPPPPNLTAPPQPLPQPLSGRMPDLEANHLAVTKAYHLLASQLCLLLAWLEVPRDDHCRRFDPTP